MTAIASSSIHNLVGGKWITSTSPAGIELVNPATGEPLGNSPAGSAAEVDAAVQAAHTAFASWRSVPAVDRVQYLFKLKTLLEEHIDELASLITIENGKTLAESKAELRRGIENVEVACGIPVLMQGYSLEDVAPGIDEIMVR
ncbi:MAG: aldehyde dehydrogenase family protein, partial [Terracidiphilus sp.]